MAVTMTSTDMTTLPGKTFLKFLQEKDIPAIKTMLEHDNVFLDERDEAGQTFLMIACQDGSTEIVDLLLSKDVELDAVDNDNWTALLNAAKGGYENIVEKLLEKNADIEHRDIGNWTALTWATYKGHSSTVQLLLNKNANPNIFGDYHVSPLMWASGRGHLDIVKSLIAAKAKVNVTDKYGNTPLIWASRKGHADIVKCLLENGAHVDNIGMNSLTALMMSAKGGFEECVRLILEFNPLVNAVDKDGYTALTLASRCGNYNIARQLLQIENVYVNLPDKSGDTTLIHAVKHDCLDIVKGILSKHPDIDVQGEDGKSALYWGVEKGHIEIVKELLLCDPSLDLPTKDGDTALLKSVRLRNIEMVELLLDKGAKVSLTDKKGDSALHIAVRSRSKRIAEMLLRNPKDSRLLYRPNKNGETPYQIDSALSAHGRNKSILTQIFGARHLNAEESIQGYDLYSSTIADVLSEPTLNTPITVGLYAKWGSGKSFLIDKLQKEMKAFTQHSDNRLFSFTLLQFTTLFCFFLIIGNIIGFAFNWKIGLGIGIGLFSLIYIFLFYVWYGCRYRNWNRSYLMSRYLALKLDSFQLLSQILFCNEPCKRNRETAHVKFLFTNNARMAGVVGEKSIATMITTLSEALEQEYGLLCTRLYRVFKPKSAQEYGNFKKICCIPYFLILGFTIICSVSCICIICYFVKQKNGINLLKNNTSALAIIGTLSCLIGLAILTNVFTWSKMFIGLFMSPRRRITQISGDKNNFKLENYIESIKKEVEVISSLTKCMDSFKNKHTRLVVIVDGLDSCEQDKLLQVLDIVHMLFSDTNHPFVTILAVDPHVIIKGIESNLSGLFRDSSITGHDYLKTIVHLPFFLQGLAPTRQNRNDGGITPKRRDSQNFMSKGRLRESNFTSSFIRQASNFDLTKTLAKASYFSDINPRNMRRLMNIVAVTGRLLRANDIDFNWYRLAAWINVTEQWPYRMSWIIFEIEDNDEIDNNVTLKEILDKIVNKIPQSKDIEPLLEIDRNPRKLEICLSSHHPYLTVADLKLFLPCTINIDPFLRKVIRDMQIQQEQNDELLEYSYLKPHSLMTPIQHDSSLAGRRRNLSGENRVNPNIGSRLPPHLQHRLPSLINYPPLFNYPYAATGQLYQDQISLSSDSQNIDKTFSKYLPTKSLRELTSNEVANLYANIDLINKKRITEYTSAIIDNNINGEVLYGCNLDELKSALNMAFGDWEIFKNFIKALRNKPDSIQQIPPAVVSKSVDDCNKEKIENQIDDHCTLKRQTSMKRDRNDSFVNEILIENQFINSAIDDDMQTSSEDEHANDFEVGNNHGSNENIFSSHDSKQNMDDPKIKSILKNRQNRGENYQDSYGQISSVSTVNSTPFVTPGISHSDLQSKDSLTLVLENENNQESIA